MYTGLGVFFFFHRREMTCDSAVMARSRSLGEGRHVPGSIVWEGQTRASYTFDKVIVARSTRPGIPLEVIVRVMHASSFDRRIAMVYVLLNRFIGMLLLFQYRISSLRIGNRGREELCLTAAAGCQDEDRI